MIVPPRPAWKRYGFAIALLIVATIVRYWLNSILGSRSTNITYFVAMLLTTWYAGLGPSILSLLIGTSLGTLLFLDYHNITPLTLITTLALQLSVSGLVIGFVEINRRMQSQIGREIKERIRISELEREQSERLRITLRSIGDAVIATDADGLITSMNPVAEALTGWPESEAVGMPLRTVFRPVKEDTRSTAEMPVAEVMAAGRVLRTVEPAVLTSRDGRSRNVDYTTAPMLDAQGRALGVVLVFHDDTDRRKIEQNLAEQTQIAEALHSIGRRLAYDLLSERRIVPLVVDEASRLVGADHAAFYPLESTTPITRVRRSSATLDGDADDSAILSAIPQGDRVVRLKDLPGDSADGPKRPEGVRSLLAIRVESRSGTTFGTLLFTHRNPSKFGAAAERLIVGIASQMAVALESARLYHDLQESETRFRQMAEHINDVFYIMEPERGGMTYASPAYEAVWERSAELLLLDPRSYLDPVHPDDRLLLESAIAARRQGEPTATEYRLLSKSGDVRWIWDRAFPIKDPSGTTIKLAGIAEDITGRKTAEEALKDSDRRKDEFLAMLAHELRNPLAPIRNSIHLMKQTEANESTQHELAMVERQVVHMTRLIDDLLDVSRISRGKITLKREPVVLSELVKRVVATNRPMIEAAGHCLNVDLPDSLTRILADPTRIEQVLGNLLNNACKYTDSGGTIDLAMRLEGSAVVLSVRDTGIGIDPKLLPKVFDLFIQAEQRVDRAQGGLGIGLSLVRDLVRLHDGSTEVFSRGLDLGSEFVVRLPTIEAAAAAQIDDLLPTIEIRSGRVSKLGRHRILVVDDNGDAATSLAKLLTRLWGQDVRIANDGHAAIDEALDFLPDLIFLDIGLPGLSGYQVARRLRATPACESTRLVAMTGWGQDSDLQKSRESGFDRHLVKPVEPDAIGLILEELDRDLIESHSRSPTKAG